MRNKKRLLLIALSTILPMVLLGGVYFTEGIYPYSNNTLLNFDMFQQYVAFFASLKSIVSGGNSIFYNWSEALGGDYYSLYAYYLASPLSYLTLLWKNEDLPTAIYFLTLLKIGLCGLTFSLFIIFRPNSKNPNYSVVLFSLCYALMSYNMMYSICLMWIDGVIMLPLIALNMEKIAAKGKGIGLSIALGIACAVNYYTAYMICVFSVLYLSYVLSVYGLFDKSRYREKWIVVKCYIFNLVCAIGLAIPVLLPVGIQLLSGKVKDNRTRVNGFFTANILGILKRFIVNDYDTIMTYGKPLVFCGTAILFLFVVYIIANYKDKFVFISALAIFVIMILSFWIAPINRIWHGFKDPVCFPHRFSFLLSFFIIQCAYISYNTIFVGGKGKIEIVRGGICLLTICELVIGAGIYRTGINVETLTINKNEYIRGFTNYRKMFSKLDDERNYYRLENDCSFSDNDPFLFDYNGIQYFSSTYNDDVLKFMKAIGHVQYNYHIHDEGGTQVSDSLLGVKYVANRGEISKGYKEYDDKIFENINVLPIGYVVKNVEENIVWGVDPFENINHWCKSLNYETEDIYKKVMFNIKSIERRGDYEELNIVYPDSEKEMYLFISMPNDCTADYSRPIMFEVYNGSEKVWEADRASIHKVPSILDDKGLYIKNVPVGSQIFLSEFEYDEYMNFIENIKNNSTINESYVERGRMYSHLKSYEDGVCIFSIPYDKGIEITIDGKRNNYSKAIGTMVCVPVKRGEHTICIKYVPVGFKTGCLIWLVILIILLSVSMCIKDDNSALL